MTVRELITLLSDYSPEATVMVADALVDRYDIAVWDTSDPNNWHQVEPSESNPFRGGALEQLFDGASTGIDDPEP